MIWIMLQVLAAYLFIFQAKRNQKIMDKRTGILLPYLEQLPEKNQDFFLRTLEALKIFKQSVADIQSSWAPDEKAFYRFINTLNTSLTALEKDADPEIRGLFQQTTQLIANLRANIPSGQSPDVWTYRLLDYVRRRSEQTQNLPKKWQNATSWWATDDHSREEQKRIIEEENKARKAELIKQIDFPRRMKHVDFIRFLEFMWWKQERWHWSHFSYSITDTTSWNTYTITVAKKTENYWDTFRAWIFQTNISAEFVLQKWREFNV